MVNKLLSRAMMSSETPVVYSMTFNSPSDTSAHYILSSSESQGFHWNQDLFASQYQQMCKVVYDGHEDELELLLQKVRDTVERHDEPPRYHDVFDRDNEDIESEDTLVRRRLSEEMTRPRRRSERSISFVSDSKNGHYRRAETVVIDVETDTPENLHLKSLVGKF
ncbi:LAMI_0E14686g1_1 [Lachancea mirantina]|uniref:LAMI_0E14686g1_1 n=1 Tax=Lachancea mirantina TaxID=1230905 RepID=A0A1G4JRS6_9SACH|nr:LAMI_0E14686g1_1 [Lachancea mirantina]